jgi:type IV pilus assembly protein PilB
MPPVTNADDYLLQLALEEGLISRDQVAEVEKEASARVSDGTPTSLFRMLVSAGALDVKAATELLAGKFNMRTVDLTNVQVPPDVLALVTRSQALHYNLLPLNRHRDTLEVVISDPLDTDGVDTLAHKLQMSIVPLLAATDDIMQVIDRHYGKEENALLGLLGSSLATGRYAESNSNELGEENSDSDAPIINLVQSMITRAVQQRASDIHLEPLERSFRVRYRIDGVLIITDSPPPAAAGGHNIPAQNYGPNQHRGKASAPRWTHPDKSRRANIGFASINCANFAWRKYCDENSRSRQSQVRSEGNWFSG